MIYKNTKTGKIHSKETWMDICSMAVLNLEVDMSPEEYFQEKIEKGTLTLVENNDIENIKRANYKILYFSEKLANHVGVVTQVEIKGLNIEILLFGNYMQVQKEYFYEMLEKYKEKVYKEYNL